MVKVTDNWLAPSVEQKLYTGSRLLIENEKRFTVSVEKKWA